MMVEAFRNNVYEAASKRVDPAFLDSVIRTELGNDDLPKKYKFMVADEFGEPIKFAHAPSTYSSKLDTLKTGKTILFPSNILDDDLYLHVWFPEKNAFLFTEMWGPLVISLTLMMLIIVALMFMFKTILTQNKLSEMKNDFISNMTHEFKTPISTISLACEAMEDDDMVSGGAADMKPYVRMISDENKRLGVLVERILQSAVTDKGQLKLNKESIILQEVIHDVAQNAKLRIQNSGGKIVLELPSELITVDADKMHLTNLISNLVDNAIKYSEKNPQVQIKLGVENKKVLLSVKDAGIGIKKEHLNKIFDKLFRVPTGNLHNVKGFGLGLSYVKAIADLHGWTIGVKSKFGEGSEFTLTIQQTHDKKDKNPTCRR
jgi:two-component system phosphate regulon sensor histidine kinase PhoR